MASTREKFTKDGQRFFEIRVRRGRDKSEVSTRWYPPGGKRERWIQQQLKKQEAAFIAEVEDGAVLSRKEKSEAAAQEAARIEKENQVNAIVKDYVTNTFLPAIERARKENTVVNYTSLLQKHILPAIGEKRLRDVSPGDVNAIVNGMQDSGFKVSTVQRVWAVCHAVFAMALDEERIDRIPMKSKFRPVAVKTEADKGPDAFSIQEVNHILDLLKDEPLKWRCYISLLIFTGCRRGEGCGLQWEDIDFTDGVITFARSLNSSTRLGVYASSPKSGKSRRVVADARLLAMLKQRRRESSPFTRWVFTQDGDETSPMHPDTPTRFFARFGKRHGIENFHPHKCRHTFASIAIEEGSDVVSVSKVLGHADSRITLQVYAHASDASAKRVSEAFSQAVGN